jgi:mannan endo-1,4-beta-mannosidase
MDPDYAEESSMTFLARVRRSRIVAVALSGAAIAAVVAATVGVVRVVVPDAPPSAQSSGNVPTPFRNNPVRIVLPHRAASYLGVYVDGIPHSYAPMESFATATGVQPNVSLYYIGWNEPFDTIFAKQAAAHNVVPLVQIDPTSVSLTAIASGVYDTYLKIFANAVARYGVQTKQGVIIGFGHEPNGPWYPWGWKHVSAALWIAAWRHIVDVFRGQGADDVTWLWTINIIYTRGGILSPDRWWPGSSYVTWVGIDGYYYKPSWTFASLFGPTIKAVRALTLDPIVISETGVAPAAGQSAKITDLFAGIRAYGLLGFVWFNADRRRDWRLNGPAAFAAFRRGAAAYESSAS